MIMKIISIRNICVDSILNNVIKQYPMDGGIKQRIFLNLVLHKRDAIVCVDMDSFELEGKQMNRKWDIIDTALALTFYEPPFLPWDFLALRILQFFSCL